MEPQPLAPAMQRELIDQITKADPAYLVWVEVQTSWLWSAYSDPTILEWANGKGYRIGTTHPQLVGAGGYIRTHYDLVGVVDIQSHTHTEYVWGADAEPYLAERLAWRGDAAGSESGPHLQAFWSTGGNASLGMPGMSAPVHSL